VFAAAGDRAQAPRAFNSADFRNVVGAFATGVTVITTHGEADAYGMTANAFSSVSLDPPLVLVCVVSGTAGAETIERNGAFAVNILATHQEPISRFFASKDRPRGAEAFAEISHLRGVTGCPIIDGCAGHLDCTLVASHEAGDHVIYVGEVQALELNPEAQPLLFHAGKYRQLQD
jgi:flavin reductase (DIM6/NTAB) family NADH-FMN oxidoreductase RutF